MEQPIEINHANRHTLMHMPGIGLKGVDTILRARRKSKIGDMTSLR